MNREMPLGSRPTLQILLTCVCLALLIATPGLAQDRSNANPRVQHGAQASAPVVPFVYEGDVRLLPKTRAWQPGDAVKEIPKQRREPAYRAPAVAGKRDPLLDLQHGPLTKAGDLTAPGVNVAGQGYTGVNPPDTVGEVGPSHYIQMINGSGGALFTIHDKSTGAVLAGPTALDSLGSGFCANGLGDPIVLYDRLADRWLLSEFSSSGNRLCVYVSQGPNPITDGYFNYDFQAPSFPDYPKYGVWPDAYYVGANESSSSLYALDRTAMLAGQPATFQRMTVSDLGGFGFQMVIPSDLDGATPPPAGTPNFFMRHRDDESHNGGPDPSQDFLEIFEFSVDFANAANTTVTGPLTIGVAEFDSSLCGLTSFNCIEQPGTNTQLDPLREVVMWRLQYRNFGSHETLVGNLAADVNGADQAGIRWFELRRTGGAGAFTLFQEGTFAPDGDSRWMGSAAMDISGNIAVAYNVSSGTTFPGLRYAGRLASDAAGSLGQGEESLVAGTASNGSNRYGDYASLNVDPADDCTFWFTGEYNTASQWSTRIGSFRFASCSSDCGNGAIDSGEACDGSLLGGQTCASFGCSGGTLACDASCSGFDLSGCFGCPAICGDGTCDSGEDCNNCAADCPSFTTTGAACGNGVCEAGNGEDCVSCAADCNGRQSGNPNNRFCCGDGDGQNPVSCSDSRCSASGFGCTTIPVNPFTSCCGDLVCDGQETSLNCPLDCGACTVTQSPETSCTDGVDNDCDGDIDCDDADCALDAACNVGGCNLGQLGDSCSVNGDCCSNKCKGKNGSKTCR